MSHSAALTCDELNELVVAVALDVAEPDVVAAVEAHAQSCPSCSRALDEMREVAAGLALASPRAEPPPRLKARVLGAALAERPPRVQPLRRSRPRLSPVWAAVAAAVLVSAGSLGWAASLQGQVSQLQGEAETTRERAVRYDRIVTVLSSTQLRVVPLTAAEFATNATGMIYLDPSSQQGMIMVHQLPPPQPGRVYQLWFNRDNERVSGGILRADATGTGYTILNLPPDVRSFESVWVTEEPQGGSTWPTTPRVVWTRIRAD